MKELPNPMFAISQLGLRRAPRALPAIAPQPSVAPVAAGITVQWARHQDEVRAAQSFRSTTVRQN